MEVFEGCSKAPRATVRVRRRRWQKSGVEAVYSAEIRVLVWAWFGWRAWSGRCGCCDGREGGNSEDRSAGATTQAHRFVVGPTHASSLESAHLVTTNTGAEELGYVFAPIPGGEEHPLFRYDPVTSEVVYYLQDAMGSVIGLADQTATNTSTLQYDGFGNERASTGVLAAPPVASRGDYRFHGMWRDASTDLYYVRARTYDARTGRFLSRDPVEGQRARPETFEGSRFLQGNPYVMRDPAGPMTLQELGTALVNAAVQAAGAIARSGAMFLRSLLAVNVPYLDAGVGLMALVFYASNGNMFNGLGGRDPGDYADGFYLFIQEGQGSAGFDNGGSEMGPFHQSIGAGRPGVALTYSYGLPPGVGLWRSAYTTGVVYEDRRTTYGTIRRAVPITREQRNKIGGYLSDLQGQTGTYSSIGGMNCNQWTDAQWDYIVSNMLD